MHDDLSLDDLQFEGRFADAFERFLADAPVEVDAVQTAGLAASAAARRRAGFLDRLPRLGELSRTSRRTMVAATVALLLLATVATIVLIGSLNDRPRLGGEHLLLTNGAYDCQNLIRFDVGTGAQETVVECVDRLKVAPGGTRAAARGANGIEIIDLANGSAEPMASARGEFTTPAAWSPRGTWLHWVSCDSNTEGCRGFVGQPGSPTANEIPEPESGYNGSFLWSAGEAALVVWDGETVLVGTGDGAGLTLQPGWGSLPFAISPGAQSVATARGRNLSGGELVQSDLYVRTWAEEDGIRATSNPDGSFAMCAAWSPDAATIAVLVIHSGTSAAPVLPTAELLLVTPDGVLQRRWPIPVASGLDCSVLLGVPSPITWAPDGEHVLIEPAQIDENPPPAAFVVTVETGQVLSLEGLERGAFGPDGQSIAALADVAMENPDDIEFPGTLVIVDLATGDRRSLGPVTVGGWSVLEWAP